MMAETIVALSSGAVPSAIAIIRLSGPDAVAAAVAIAGPLPPPRSARVRPLRDPADGLLLDRAIVVQFDAPDTATGEPLVELHVHGGRAVVAAVEASLLAYPGVRRAEAGEFTRRALFNGRIDLSQVEGLADLLAAETEGQRRAALRMAEGDVGRSVEIWNQRLLALAARVEAAIDFSDEEDADPGDSERFGVSVAVEVAQVAGDIAVALAHPPAERLRDGVRLVLAGPPNSGKSTLFNRLVDRDAAITSPIAGTTRDRIDAPVVIGGIAFVVTDTAGLAETTDDVIEAIGIERAEAAMRSADIVLWLGDGPAPILDGAIILALHARCDVADRSPPIGPRDVAVSGRSGEGLDRLTAVVLAAARGCLPTSDALAYSRRQRGLLASAVGHLRAIADAADILIVAEELRAAMRDLDRITGNTDTEAMLDTLFAGFCIGK